MAVTTQSAANSILGWSDTDFNSFNGGSHPWVAYRTSQSGTAPNTVQEVIEFIGEELSERSYTIVNNLKSHDAKLGFSTGHNPCF